MNKELKKKWTDALRSGEYKQCKGVLRKDGPDEAFCCLGVLCEVDPAVYNGEIGYSMPGGFSQYTLPTVYAEGMGLEERAPGLPEQSIRSRLMCMNDEMGRSFDSIADFIDANVRED